MGRLRDPKILTFFNILVLRIIYDYYLMTPTKISIYFRLRYNRVDQDNTHEGVKPREFLIK